MQGLWLHPNSSVKKEMKNISCIQDNYLRCQHFCWFVYVKYTQKLTTTITYLELDLLVLTEIAIEVRDVTSVTALPKELLQNWVPFSP